MIAFFITLQCILLFFMLFHDWIPVPPLNDIPTLRKLDSRFYRFIGSTINGVLVLIPLILTWIYSHAQTIAWPANLIIVLFYALLTIGTILSWWVPYFFGSSQKLKIAFAKFKHTHHFLPAYKDHIVPNTLHVILHLQVWTCLALSIYFWVRS
jgi:hypothetical protein